MKKSIIYFLSLFATTMGFVACSEDLDITDQPEADSNMMIISASMNTASRTEFIDTDKGYKVVWSEGDKILVGGKEFSLVSGAGTVVGKFQGERLANGTYDAYYGIDSKSLPATQTATEGKINSAPMMAQVEVNDGVANGTKFSNLCGLLSIHVTPHLGYAAAVKTITVTADKPLSGAFEVTDHAAVMTGSEATSMTLDCGGESGVALSESGNDFCLALPAGEYHSFTITLADADGTPIFIQRLAKGKRLTINRSDETRVGSSFTLINSTMPVGTIGWYKGREAIITDLGGSIGKLTRGSIGKLAIATFNEGVTNTNMDEWWLNIIGMNMAYTNAAATEWGNGWRLPTKEEFEALGQLPRRWVFDADGDDEGIEFTIGESNFFLPVNWLSYGEVRYWTSTEAENYSTQYTKYHYYLYADRGSYDVVPFDDTYSFGIRLFCDLPASGNE